MIRNFASISVITLFFLIGFAMLFNTRATLKFMTRADADTMPEWLCRARDPNRWDNFVVHAFMGAAFIAMTGPVLRYAVWSTWSGLALWVIGTSAFVTGMKPLWLDTYLALSALHWTSAYPRIQRFFAWSATRWIPLPAGLALIVIGIAIYAVVPIPPPY